MKVYMKLGRAKEAPAASATRHFFDKNAATRPIMMNVTEFRKSLGDGGRWIGAATAVLVSCLQPLAAAEDVVLYRQVFGHEPPGNADMTTHVRWQQYWNIDWSPNNYTVMGEPGQPQDLGNVNSSVEAESMANGYLGSHIPAGSLYLSMPGPGEREVFQSAADLDPAHYESLTFQWRHACHVQEIHHRLAIQIGDNWYASEETFQNVIRWNPFAENAVEAALAFTKKGSEWRDLEFDASDQEQFKVDYSEDSDNRQLPAAVLKLAEEPRKEDLPDGPIVNFGILGENIGNSEHTGVMIDTLEIVGRKKGP